MNKAMNIGQKVRNAYGETGTIVDRMYSEKEKAFVYSVSFDTRDPDEINILRSEGLRVVEDKEDENYIIETEILENVCIAKILKEKDGIKKEICRGHGHRIHEGDYGIVQALSYAFKRAYQSINNEN